MAGFNRDQPARRVVDEVITTGVAQRTGVTGWSGFGAVARRNTWTGPFLPPSTSAYVLAITVSSSNGTTTVTTGLANPDFPRAVRLAPTTSQAATGNVVVNGTNQFGVSVSDTIALGGTGAPVNGVKAFKTITSIVLPASTSGSGGAAFSLTVGLSNVFGLDRAPASVAGRIGAVVNGTVESTQPTLNVANATCSFNTSATSSAGASLEVIFVPQDTTNI